MNDKDLFSPHQVVNAPEYKPSIKSAHMTVCFPSDMTIAGKRRTITALTTLAEAIFKKAKLEHDDKYIEKARELIAESKELKQSMLPKNKGTL